MIEKDSTGTFKIPAASHKEAEPQSETRGAVANMLRAIFKVKTGAERANTLKRTIERNVEILWLHLISPVDLDYRASKTAKQTALIAVQNTSHNKLSLM